MYCGHCGTKLKGGEAFCPRCGGAVGGGTVAPRHKGVSPVVMGLGVAVALALAGGVGLLVRHAITGTDAEDSSIDRGGSASGSEALKDALRMTKRTVTYHDGRVEVDAYDYDNEGRMVVHVYDGDYIDDKTGEKGKQHYEERVSYPSETVTEYAKVASDTLNAAESGEFSKTVAVSKDEHGNVVEEVTDDYDGTIVTWETDYEYYPSGEIKSSSSTMTRDPDIPLEGYTRVVSYEYAYDEQGNLLNETRIYDSNDVSTVNYTYDDKGICISERHVYGQKDADEDDLILTTYACDKYGNRISETEDGLTIEYEVETDKDGREIRVTEPAYVWSDGEGSFVYRGRSVREYEYDKLGNTTKSSVKYYVFDGSQSTYEYFYNIDTTKLSKEEYKSHVSKFDTNTIRNESFEIIFEYAFV